MKIRYAKTKEEITANCGEGEASAMAKIFAEETGEVIEIVEE